MAYKKWGQGFPHKEGLSRAWCAGPAVCIHPVYRTLAGRSVCLGQGEETKQREKQVTASPEAVLEELREG